MEDIPYKISNKLGTVTYITADKFQHKGKILNDGVKIMTYNDSKLGTCEFANTFEWIKALDAFFQVNVITTPSTCNIQPENNQNLNQKIDGAFENDLLYTDTTSYITKNMIISAFHDVNIDSDDILGDDIGDADASDIPTPVITITSDLHNDCDHRFDCNPDNGDFEY